LDYGYGEEQRMHMGRLFQSNHEVSTLAFIGVWDAGASSGETSSFTMNILNGSGGEINTSNKTKTSGITFIRVNEIYFIQLRIIS